MTPPDNRRWQIVGVVGTLICAWSTPAWAGTSYETFDVPVLENPVTIDGKLDDWGAQGNGWLLPLADSDWQQDGSDKGDGPPKEKDREVRVWMGQQGDRLHMAAQWQDPSQNVLYKPWKLAHESYVRANMADDMFVVRFQMGDSFNRCMLTNKPYHTDVWHWSAGRSNLAGIADDISHAFSDKPFDKPSREFEGNKGIVYFLKTLDEGSPGWQSVPQPDSITTPVVPGIAKSGIPSGSRADVTAVGVWKNGIWTLEMSRRLTTGDPEDVVFVPGGENIIQIAVFYVGYRLQKFVSKPIGIRFAVQPGK